MSSTDKYIIGCLVLLCCVQYIEMARIPREDNVDKPTSELAINLQNMLDTISENFKTLVDGDTLKKVIGDFTKAIEVTENRASQ